MYPIFRTFRDRIEASSSGFVALVVEKMKVMKLPAAARTVEEGIAETLTYADLLISPLFRLHINANMWYTRGHED
jgi:hypothetical protein